MDSHCFDADPEPDPDPAQNLERADADPDGGGGSAKNVHLPWQNPRYAPILLHMIQHLIPPVSNVDQKRPYHVNLSPDTQ